ncbi:MAG: hypothetical protein A3H98_14680 [Bacteroidetes bacterium RIFCSPLOWO2_02_FULL_36_8]|nr:MAG: hypothetical protein A3H98_14680 [Bacteroidetes bacterium RIFCSPLOWO2_02_FULL_36_8]OFY71591.1 MAG: hypothetical protein A3G23_02580 [Bacteroidetes bacterium RIFCSPLOWO2_12_FULL_37_12]
MNLKYITKLVFVLLFLLIIKSNVKEYAVYAQTGFPWKTWEEAIKVSQETGKIIMIEFYTDWCGWCRKMENETFTDEKVLTRLNAGYIPVRVNPEKNGEFIMDGTKLNTRTFTDKITHGRLRGYPMLVFYSAKTKSYSFQSGYISGKDFYNLLDQVREKFSVGK